MKKPNLYYNYYYPFYTQYTWGKKTGYIYRTYAIVHLSEERGIKVELEYIEKKIKNVKFERIKDRKTLYKTRNENELITYNKFAKLVDIAFGSFNSALKKLSSEPAYRCVYLSWFSTDIKFNSEMELTFDFDILELKFDKTNYKIENEKKVKIEEESGNDGSEEASMLKNISDYLDAFEQNRIYRSIEEEKFNEDLEGVWERFVDYFEAPKFIRKSDYNFK